MSEKPTKRVSDYASSTIEFAGEHVTVSYLVNCEFTITKITELASEDGPYLGVEIQGKRGAFFFFTSHLVVYRKLRQCMGKEPLLATIRKREPRNGGYSFFDVE